MKVIPEELFDTLRGKEIRIRIAKLEPEMLGMVYKSSRNNYYIVINKDITYELQQAVLIHEMRHIQRHMPENTYIIGLDMQHTKIEKEADSLQEVAVTRESKFF